MSSRGGELYELFRRACSLQGDERARLIADVGARDGDLAAELRALLSADEDGGALPGSATLEASPPAAPRVASQADESQLREQLAELGSLGRGARAYELGAELGSGAMGRVRRVVDRSLRRELAMKTLRDDGLGEPDPVRLARFLNEARVLGKLDHPGIVSIHELGTDGDGRPYFTMPVVAGGELGSVFEKARNGEEDWSLPRAVGVLQRVCEAMAFAHENGVVHRDLKPANVMVGRFGEVQVMDWGLARTRGEPERRDLRPADPDTAADDSPVRTMDGTVVGTPCFMSPEQARGRVEDIDGRSDVYAVGAMLYELLAGRRPYEEPGSDNAPYAVLSRLLEREPTPVSAGTAGSVPSELVAICEKAMHRDRESRYATMEELGADLRAFLENRVVRAHRTGPLVELTKWVGRNRVAASALALVLVSTVGGSLYLAARERENAASERELTKAATDQAEKARQETAAADRALGFLEGLFGASNPQIAHGEVPNALELLDRGAATIAEELGDDPLVRARLEYTMGSAFRELGHYEQAEQLLASVLETRERQLGPRDGRTLTARTDYALLLKRKGDYRAAERAYREALDAYLDLHGERHVNTLVTMNNLSQVYMLEGRYDEAVDLLQPCVELGDTLRGPDDQDSIAAVNNLGLVYQLMRRFEEAEPLLQEAVARLERTVGRHSANMPSALNNLGTTRMRLGRFDEAAECLEEAVAIARDVYPPGHWSYFQCLKASAELQNHVGNHEEARRLWEECVHGGRAHLGEHHRYTLTYVSGLAMTNILLERFAEAEELLDEMILAIPTTDTRYPQTLLHLADLAREQGRVDEAQAAYREVIALAEGSGHVSAQRPRLSALQSLGAIEFDAERWTESRELLEECWAAASTELRRDDSIVLDTLPYLTELRRLDGDAAGALELCREILAITTDPQGREYYQALEAELSERLARGE